MQCCVKSFGSSTAGMRLRLQICRQVYVVFCVPRCTNFQLLKTELLPEWLVCDSTTPVFCSGEVSSVLLFLHHPAGRGRILSLFLKTLLSSLDQNLV